MVGLLGGLCTTLRGFIFRVSKGSDSCDESGGEGKATGPDPVHCQSCGEAVRATVCDNRNGDHQNVGLVWHRGGRNRHGILESEEKETAFACNHMPVRVRPCIYVRCDRVGLSHHLDRRFGPYQNRCSDREVQISIHFGVALLPTEPGLPRRR